jgi:hypothetical protein
MIRALLWSVLAIAGLCAEPIERVTALPIADENSSATQPDKAEMLSPMRPKLIYLTPQEPPEGLYVHQTIEVQVDALVTESTYDRFTVNLSDSSGVRRVGPEPRWERLDENRHRLTLFFRVTDTRPQLPALEAQLYIEGALVDRAMAHFPIRRARQVESNAHYTGVVAEELEILTHKVERFDEQQNILVMDMKGHLSNLGSFTLPGIQTQGTDWVEEQLPQTRIFFYALLPNHQESISFNTFDPTSGNYQRFDIDFDLSDLGQNISTHADINPKSRSIPWLEIFVLFLASVLLILFWFKTHRNFFLVMVALTLILALWLILRDEQVTIQEGAQVRLLPTSTSTLFYVTYRPTEAMVLQRKDGYIKVHLPDDKIGWIRKEETVR